MENHRYLHASRLFTLAKVVHDNLEDESNQSVIDIEMAFPVVQRQWDAVSVFGPQIIQRSTHYLRISEQSPEVGYQHFKSLFIYVLNYFTAHCRINGWTYAFR
jgi:hypothetical protein